MNETATTGFTELEIAEIGHAADDHAARYYGGPLELCRDDAARYVSEGHLGHLISRHGLGTVWAAVADYLSRNPAVLELTEIARTEARHARIDAAEQARRNAKRNFDAGDFDSSLAMIAAAERLDPHFGGYASIRLMISKAAAAPSG